jgi:hypothetical protein
MAPMVGASPGKGSEPMGILLLDVVWNSTTGSLSVVGQILVAAGIVGGLFLYLRWCWRLVRRAWAWAAYVPPPPSLVRYEVTVTLETPWSPTAELAATLRPPRSTPPPPYPPRPD